ncbi:hypothetical protein GOP47_0021463 [Adiantum capillus-veneris]|uniref:UspA domain-containing protein n=1 Tax=Adiantum capillus-veneris TaxID=13818 RepID=A0A9D4U7G2_ADICA|nr:hypothetical protein GOP47_0021463 [Adiantum capillus-veneris]
MSILTEIVEAAEEDEPLKDGAREALPPTAPLTMENGLWSSNVQIAVAVGKGGSSEQALRWVLDSRLVPPGGLLHLLHIQAPLRFIPSPMGNNLPLESVSEDVANRHKMQRFLATEQLLFQYKKMCDDRQVNSEVSYAEGEVVHKELVSQISSLCVAKLIIGTSSNSKITRALKKQSVGSLVSKNAPDFCTIIVVCKGKVQSTREARKAS